MHVCKAVVKMKVRVVFCYIDLYHYKLIKVYQCLEEKTSLNLYKRSDKTYFVKFVVV